MKKNDIDRMGALNKKVKILGDGIKVIRREIICSAVYSLLKHVNHTTGKPLEHPMTSCFFFVPPVLKHMRIGLLVCFMRHIFGADQSLLFILFMYEIYFDYAHI